MRFALRVVQVGAVAAVVAVTTYFTFELDRFFIPKELVLHLTAALAALAAMRTLREATTTRIDHLLAAWLGLCALSALFATNRWLGLRALAISASSVLLFWVARRLREAGYGRAVVAALAVAVVAVAVTSLLQTYGLDIALFSENRSPGGTLGNRNFVAHAAAFGLPLVLLAAIGAQRCFALGAAGAALATASLVLTRSRAAWLAFAVVVVVFLAAMLASPPMRRDARAWRRLALIVLVIAAGAGAALVLPNALRWRDKNPYLQTVRHVTDYESGSGHGRLVQYTRSLVLTLHHPLFGAGPGNWAVRYPEQAARHDPSLSDGDPGMTTNPWPSSDWVAWLAERGPFAFALIALAFLGIAAGGVRQLLASQTPEEGLAAAALLATVAGACMAGLFDAVLLLALPSFLVWTAIGALFAAPPTRRPLPVIALVAIVLVSAAGATYSAMQIAAMHFYDAGAAARAARVDPGNYRAQLRLARGGGRARCEHARAAHALYPNAVAAKQASRGCR